MARQNLTRSRPPRRPQAATSSSQQRDRLLGARRVDANPSIRARSPPPPRACRSRAAQYVRLPPCSELHRLEVADTAFRSSPRTRCSPTPSRFVIEFMLPKRSACARVFGNPVSLSLSLELYRTLSLSLCFPAQLSTLSPHSVVASKFCIFRSESPMYYSLESSQFRPLFATVCSLWPAYHRSKLPCLQ